MKLSVLIELLSRRISIVFPPEYTNDLTFRYLKQDGDHYAIMTNENIAVPLYTDGRNETGLCIVTEPCKCIEQMIFDCIDTYRNWREECLQAASDSSVNELLDSCASLLRNPVALFDESLVMTAYAGNIPVSVEGTIWEMVLSEGISRPEIYSREENDMIARELGSGKKSFVWNSSLFNGHTHICSNVFRNGTPCGLIGASDLYGGFSEGEICLFEDVSDFITLYYSRSHAVNERETNLYYIERLLNGLSVSHDALARSIRPLGWKTDHTWQVYCLSKGVSNEYAYTSYRKRLQKLFAHSLVLPHEDHLVLLINLSKETGDVRTHLTEEFGFRCGAGLPFHDLTNLYYAYIQSRIALSFVHEEGCMFFEDVYQDYITESLSKLTDIKALCHPRILELYESDDPGNRTLINNLRTYLLCGRNIAETSRKLFVHRNTLLYRLEKIDQLLGVHLSDIKPEEVFLYLMSCMIVES